MTTTMPRPLMASQAQTPPLGRCLWLTLGSLGFGALNLRFFAELWPHTPVARLWLLGLVWLLLLTLPLQLVGWAWRWLRAYAGPGWVWLLASVGFLGVACLGVLAWAMLLVVGVGAWIWS